MKLNLRLNGLRLAQYINQLIPIMPQLELQLSKSVLHYPIKYWISYEKRNKHRKMFCLDMNNIVLNLYQI